MTNANCWEAMACGRELGGLKVEELGICPASLAFENSGQNGGLNGGRICWAISGTFCSGQISGTCATHQFSCAQCSFYNQVRSEQGKSFMLLPPGQHYARPGGGLWENVEGE